MKIVTIKQNSQEWRSWRGKGLGASDAPAVMGDSPWTSPFELWLEKTGLFERPPANEFQKAAMKRGTELEPVVREEFEKHMDKLFPSVSAEHGTYEYLRASFDGYNEETNTILEIKCPNKLDHAKAVKGAIPPKYKAQVQQQLMISGAEKCYYVSWDGKKMAIVEVMADPIYQAQLLEAMIDFWARVCSLQLPDVTDQDVAKVITFLNENVERVNRASKILALLTPTKTDKTMKDVK